MIIRYLNFAILSGALAYGWSLNITVSGVQVDPGSNIGIGLFRPDDPYPTIGKEYRGVYLLADSPEVTCSFKNIEDGIYAVSVYHDKNGNRLLDENFFGIPLEGYGFSNNARGIFSAPSFEEASLTVDGDTSITVNLHY
ncbi:MAG: hypothetical protein B5M52_04095 [Helicobacteraceae bacterium 4484_230]|nr:MAG: hypothetical protein B5M52_04095 [Helicobacteraceae bacterium 4484_230]